ncbi:MAG: hypothetical protein IKG85_09270 [Clostridia bacterium]|nr:hypothetical protein [Clostridia bacterium]
MGFARTLSSAVNGEGNNYEFVSTGAYLRVLRYAMDLINAIPAFGNRMSTAAARWIPQTLS